MKEIFKGEYAGYLMVAFISLVFLVCGFVDYPKEKSAVIIVATIVFTFIYLVICMLTWAGKKIENPKERDYKMGVVWSVVLIFAGLAMLITGGVSWIFDTSYLGLFFGVVGCVVVAYWGLALGACWARLKNIEKG